MGKKNGIFSFHKNRNSCLLINPPVYDFSVFDLWSKPLGLLYLASFLKNCGFRIQVIDCMDRNDPELLKLADIKTRSNRTGKYFKEVVIKPQKLRDIPRNYSRYGIPGSIFESKIKNCELPEIIFITSHMTYWYPGVQEAIEKCRKIFPGVPLILGGIYATLCPEHASTLGADKVFQGPFEYSKMEIMEQYASHFLRAGFEKDSVSDLFSHLYPYYECYEKLIFAPLLTRRGCPFECSYCASHLLYKGVFTRNPEDVVEEIEYYFKNLGITDFAFYDDALLIDKREHIIPILECIVKKEYSFQFQTPNGLHVREIDYKLADLLRKAGFHELRLSFERLSNDWRQRTGNKVTPENLQNAVNALLKAGFSFSEINIYIMIGFNDEKIEDVIDSVSYVYDCGAKPRIVEYSPIPGTVEYIKFINIFKDTDPLLQNKTISIYKHPKIPHVFYQKLKEIVQLVNNDPVIRLKTASEVFRKYWEHFIQNFKTNKS